MDWLRLRQIDLRRRPSLYRPAQLYYDDQENGDANAICFGPQEIDPGVWRKESVEIIVDMEKFRDHQMERKNPCIFFKQQDLGYRADKTRAVNYKNISLEFNHTTIFQSMKSRHAGFILNPDSSDADKYAQVRNQELISANFESMTAIQTLNFFRYLDNLTDGSFNEDLAATDAIYNKIAQLDDTELVDFLAQVHQQATDTAEFNFYGAYRIDPELIDTIRSAPNGDTPEGSFLVSLPKMIEQLNEGDATLYREAKEKIPFLFESKRFMNFLRSKVKNPRILEV